MARSRTTPTKISSQSENEEAERKRLDEEIRRYYDSFTEEQMAEDAAWGGLGEQALMHLFEEEQTRKGALRKGRKRRLR
ncbi:MAG TPA: hypothetical protein VGQ71_07530 [Terriglobales bacterium]|jgi:predicted house-cleaning noncanonical NTP pyrophosphatase (MazG superfamily)|nr:hypothetical protein [Terriglobales bacterium]